MTERDELGTEALELLDALRRDLQPRATLAEELRPMLAAKLAAPTSNAWWWKNGLALVIVGALAVPWIGAQPDTARIAPALEGLGDGVVAPPSERIATVARVEPIAPHTDAAIVDVPAPTKSRVEPPRKRRATRVAAAPSEPPPKARPVGDALAAELALLSEAERERRAGRPTRALELLARHAAEFEPAQLAAERDVARVLALCDAGRTADARAQAHAFARDSPAPHLRRRIDRSCAGTK